MLFLFQEIRPHPAMLFLLYAQKYLRNNGFNQVELHAKQTSQLFLKSVPEVLL